MCWYVNKTMYNFQNQHCQANCPFIELTGKVSAVNDFPWFELKRLYSVVLIHRSWRSLTGAYISSMAIITSCICTCKADGEMTLIFPPNQGCGWSSVEICALAIDEYDAKMSIGCEERSCFFLSGIWHNRVLLGMENCIILIAEVPGGRIEYQCWSRDTSFWRKILLFNISSFFFL